MSNRAIDTGRVVYIVDGARTPFLKAQGKPGPFTAADLAVNAARPLLMRQQFLPADLDEIIVGCVMPSPDETNIARIIALRLGCGYDTPAWTVQRNCASGLQAIDNASINILSGRHDLILAGGTEAMSHAPLMYSKAMIEWLSSLYAAKKISAKLNAVSQFRPKFLKPVVALLRGLTDPVVGLNMGQTAENLAYHFGISREDSDRFAQESHNRLANAQDQDFLMEIEPIFDQYGNFYASDTGLRRNSSLDKLSSLKPIFDKRFGQVTAGNSSQVTDGSCFVLLASEDAVKHYSLPVKARIIDVNWSGLDPSQMGLGPVYAIASLLQRNQLSLDDIDCWEINEAFGAQVLACLTALADEKFCVDELGLDAALGTIASEKLNTDGGAIAIGHPVGASGTRITLHLINTLQRTGGRLGIASLCIGGGQGGAILVENVAEAS